MHFTPDVALGTLIHLVTLIVTVVIAYYRLRDRQRDIQNQLDKVEVAIATLDHQYVRAAVYEAHQHAISERLGEIRGDMNCLRGDVKSLVMMQP